MGMDASHLDDSGHKCNTFLSNDGDSSSTATVVNVTIGLILTCCGLAWSAYSAGEGVNDLDPTNRNHTSHRDDQHSGPASDPEGGGNYESMSQDTENWGGAELIKPLMTYHVIMVVCTM